MPATALAIDFSELTALARKAAAAPTVTRRAAWDRLRSASLALERRVKIDMPVRYGVARASWGHWTPGDLRPSLKSIRQSSASDAVYEESEDDLAITQGSNVEYIIYLNAGHSRQAPAGFLDRDALTAQLELEKSLGLIDPLSPQAEVLGQALIVSFGRGK